MEMEKREREKSRKSQVESMRAEPRERRGETERGISPLPVPRQAAPLPPLHQCDAGLLDYPASHTGAHLRGDSSALCNHAEALSVTCLSVATEAHIMGDQRGRSNQNIAFSIEHRNCTLCLSVLSRVLSSILCRSSCCRHWTGPSTAGALHSRILAQRTTRRHGPPTGEKGHRGDARPSVGAQRSVGTATA